MKLQLERPLVLFDLETTGTDVNKDRIVEISVLKVMPDGTQKSYTRRVNPQMPIPKEASDVHHITDADVANEPTFAEIAVGLANYLKGCDIAGFNSNRFDVPLLINEFNRTADVKFDTSGVKFVDVQTIYHKREPRTLSAAYRYYCGKELEGAHGAEADIKATFEVLLRQLDMYDDLPTDISGLADYTRPKSKVPEGMTAIGNTDTLCCDKSGVIYFNFGRYNGQPVEKVFAENPGMADWCCKPERTFAPEVREVFVALRDKTQQNNFKSNTKKR